MAAVGRPGGYQHCRLEVVLSKMLE
jgi:hypothetical protein